MHGQKLFIMGILCLFIFAFAVSAEAEDTFNIYGQVTDVNNNHVSGATITLENFAYKPVATTKTDESGNFAFTSVSTENRMVKVLVSYTDKDGNTYSIPPEFCMWFNANGTIYLTEDSTQLTDYPPSGVSTRIGRLAIAPVNFPSAKPYIPVSLNANALAIALALGILLLAGVYWFLQKGR